jgi:hypothetical protein
MDDFPILPGLTWSVTKSPKFATRIQTSISGREVRVVDQPYPIWTWTLVYSFLRDKNDLSHGPALGGSVFSTGYDELRTLAGFFLRQQGSFQAFLYNDPGDNTAVNQRIGTGDGTSTQYQLIRSFGSSIITITRPVFNLHVFVSGVSAPFTTDNIVITLLSAPNISNVITASFNDPADGNVFTNELIGIGDGITTTYRLIRTFTAFSEPVTQPFNVFAFVNGATAGFSLGSNGSITLSAPPQSGDVITASFGYNFPVRFTTDMLDFENFMYQLWELKKLSFQSVLLP